MPATGEAAKAFIQSTPTQKQWDKIGVTHQHGICIPLFSIRTEKSAGIGEFLDLVPLIKWAEDAGINIIQLLPLNDNGNGTSPYSALSAFALNPLHISLHALSDWQKLEELKGIYKELLSLNQQQRIDYKRVSDLKERFLKTYFEQLHPELIKLQEYNTFKDKNPWIVPYALFKALKIKNLWSSWSSWKEDWKNPFPQHFQRLVEENKNEIEFHTFLQFICFKQLLEAKGIAKKHNVFLKGDVPILISKESADVWGERQVFHLDYSAGAPPDMYNPNGQDWEFPVYNWENIESNHYKWWKERLLTASCFYDIFRLDHIVGFYRIWAINLKNPEFQRDFIPQDPQLWIPHGEKIMKALLPQCSMLPIGEDLGVVPPEVRKNLKALGICGTKVIRWERKWEEDKSFIPFNEYEPLSMTTVSTHDSETLKLWWQYNPEEAKEFAKFKGWQYAPELKPEWLQSILYDSHHTTSLFHINLLQEYLSLFPAMAWENPEDERINFPGTLSEKNWSYKFRPSIEEIAENQELKRLMQEMTKKGT